MVSLRQRVFVKNPVMDPMPDAWIETRKPQVEQTACCPPPGVVQ
jgi:hypothetical protein